ncbi:MAG: GreA/GreB family elongation factor, partial [Bacteroidota bacterium]
ISQAVIVQKPCQHDNTVRVGTRLSIELLNAKTGAHKQQCITIGGKGEADIRKNIISVDSPIGAALIGMEAGNEKEITLPAGILKIKILSIEPE